MVLPLAVMPGIIGLGRAAIWAWRAYRAARAVERAAEAIGAPTLGTATAVGQAAQEASDDAEARPLPADTCTTGCPPDRDPDDEICAAACACMANRGTHRTLTACVQDRLRQRYDNHEGRYPRAPDADGPRTEVSFLRGPDERYAPVESRSNPGLPSSRAAVPNAPRPYIVWYEGGRPVRIDELKFPGDGQTRMQANGAYREIARDLGLDPDADLREFNIAEECECGPPTS